MIRVTELEEGRAIPHDTHTTCMIKKTDKSYNCTYERPGDYSSPL